MAKRKVTDNQLREVVRARRTKGSAFMLKGAEYNALQEQVKTELSGMSRAEIFARWPEYTYDLR